MTIFATLTMTKVTYLLISMLMSMPVFAQHHVGKDGVNMNKCEGAINIFEPGTYHMDFTGESGESHSKYSSLADIDSENSIWCSYIAPATGTLDIEASVDKGYLQMVIFKEISGDICGELSTGIAEIQRVILSKDNSSVGLRKDIASNFLYSLSLGAEEKVYVLFSTNEKSHKTMTLEWDFLEDVFQPDEPKIVDRRDDDFAPTLSVTVRDKDTGSPLVAAFVLEGHRDLEGMYKGSDFFFSMTHHTDLTISCDLEGYFFHDSIYEIKGFQDKEINIELERVAAGKSMTIEDIQFVPGTSEIMKSSEPRLKRLKDFLALNSEVEVEIQGHVFSLGENSFAGQKISEARAKRVMKYLIDNGIDRHRLTAVGYGNTRPAYPDPVRSHQEQANRRVEILVK